MSLYANINVSTAQGNETARKTNPVAPSKPSGLYAGVFAKPPSASDAPSLPTEQVSESIDLSKDPEHEKMETSG